MYGLNSSAQGHTQDRVIQTEGGEALEMNLKTLSHMILCILCYSSIYLFLTVPPSKTGEQTVFNCQCVFNGE